VTSEPELARQCCEHAEAVVALRAKLADQAEAIDELRKEVARLSAQVTRLVNVEGPPARIRHLYP
jgi:ubiquinone biosynthesis protein UbiJ